MKRKIALMGLALTVLLIDWAALDDITTGQEPSFSGEYLIVIISVPILLAIAYLLRRTNKKTQTKY